MTGPEQALEYLLAVALTFGITVHSRTSSGARVRLDWTSPSGVVHPHELELRCESSRPAVVEREPRRFPARCMERHINVDGTFCLEWPPIEVTDAASAEHYWSQLTRFVEHQHAADVLRRWPGAEHARAHGEAAEPQDEAEQLAKALGPGVVADLRRGRYRTVLVASKAGARLELHRSGSRAVQVRVTSGTLEGTRARCICDAAMAQKAVTPDCASHADTVARLAIAVDRWHRLHDESIVRAVQGGYECCGTLVECEIARMQQRMEGGSR